MSEYDNTNRGVLFKNDDKTEDKHPDYKGRINVGGTDYWLSAWIKTSKDGRKYMSLSPVPMEKVKPKPAAKAGAFDDIRDDIPF
jgi:hypothetical protein